MNGFLVEFVLNLVQWKRPVLSALVVTIGILLFWLVDQGHSFLSLISYSLVLVMIMSTCYTKMIGLYVKLSRRRDDPYAIFPHKVVYVSPKIAKQVSGEITKMINFALNFLCLNTSFRKSFGVLCCLCALGWCGQRLSDRVVFLTLFLIVMTVPPIHQFWVHIRKRT